MFRKKFLLNMVVLVRPRQWLFRYAVCLVGLALFGYRGVQAQVINFVNARFDVEYNDQASQGEQRLRIQRDGDQYQVDFVLDHWLVSSSQKATFGLDHCQVRPDSYVSTVKRPFKSETIQTLKFDWEHKKAEYRHDGEHKTFELDDRYYDPISFFFEVRCGLMAGKTEFSYPLIRKGSKTSHRYQVVGTETVHTGLGAVDALVVERQRSSQTRQTRLYVAPELDYLLVRIEHQESRLVRIVGTLSEMDYDVDRGQ